MSDFTFRPAVREKVGLFLGLAGGTGSGKTVSGLRLCTGIVGRENKFAVIDTENKRASHHAPRPGEKPDFVTTFNFDVLDFEAPFSSDRYEEYVKAAVKAGYNAIMLDSATHEHDGYGGYLDAQSQDLTARVERYMQKHPEANEYNVIEKMTPSSWIIPKRKRKLMKQTLLACSASIPIVFCFRAEEKTFQSKDGKLIALTPPLWAPICDKSMPFEMTVFFMMHADRPGVPIPIKLGAMHKPLFRLDQQLDEDAGRRIAEWARGSGTPPPNGEASSECVSVDQSIELADLLETHQISKERFFARIKQAGIADVQRIADLPINAYERSKAWIERVAGERT